MESFILQGDKSVRYQPLQSNDDANGGRQKESHDSSSQFSPRSYWPWISLDVSSNNYKKLSIGKMETPFKELRNTNLKYGILGCLCFLTMIIWAFLFYLSLKNSSSTGENISKPDFSSQIPDMSSDEDDSLMKNWEKYADEFFTFDGVGTRAIYTSPNSTLTCVQQPGLITILINSTTKQMWKDFKAEKSCAEFIIIERLELSGKFSSEDLQHILNEIPNIASLKLFSISIEPEESQTSFIQEEIVLPILTSLSIIESKGEVGESVFTWLDERVKMIFLSEILIMNSDIVVASVNSILNKSSDLKSLFLIGNSIACEDLTSCPSFTTEMTSLIELVLINGNPKQNDYWALFINAMLLKVKNDKALRILETNIPTNTTVIEILIDSELRVENRQVYEIAFRLPSLNPSSKNEFANNQIATFENYYSSECLKASTDETNSPITSLWVNLCQDSQHNIMYGFNKAKFIQDAHLAIFIRRAQTGNVVCYDDFTANKLGNKNGDFSCQNHF